MTVYQSQADFKRAVATAPASYLMNAKVTLFKRNIFFGYHEDLLSFEIDSLNGHDVHIILSDLQ